MQQRQEVIQVALPPNAQHRVRGTFDPVLNFLDNVEWNYYLVAAVDCSVCLCPERIVRTD